MLTNPGTPHATGKCPVCLAILLTRWYSTDRSTCTPRGIRTPDQTGRNRSLCPLSYEGMSVDRVLGGIRTLAFPCWERQLHEPKPSPMTLAGRSLPVNITVTRNKEHVTVRTTTCSSLLPSLRRELVPPMGLEPIRPKATAFETVVSTIPPRRLRLLPKSPTVHPLTCWRTSRRKVGLEPTYSGFQ